MKALKFFAPVFCALSFAVTAFAVVPDDYGVTSSTSGGYCPTLTVTMQYGARDTSYLGQVTELQKFLSAYYSYDPNELVTGYFGPTTKRYVQQFQKDQGFPSDAQLGIAGSMTRATIANVCGQTSPTTASTAVSPVAAVTSVTAPVTSVGSSLEQQIANLLSLITSLQTQLTAQQTTTPVQTTVTPATVVPVVTPITSTNGVCGTANGKIYPSAQTGYGSDTQCSSGNRPSTFPFPGDSGQGNTVSWICSGIGTGSSASCSASKAVANTTAITPTLSLTSNKSSVSSGESFVLSWNSTDTTSCTVSSNVNTGWGVNQPVGGSQELYGVSGQTNTFTLTCTGRAGSTGNVSKSISVVVAPATPVITPIPVISAASSISVVSGQTASVAWSTTNATSCSYKRTVGSSAPVSGSLGSTVSGNLTEMTLSETVVYEITCIGPGGTSIPKIVTMTSTPAPVITPTLSLTSNKSTYESGETITLSWNSTDTTSCTASSGNPGSGFSGNRDPNGTQTVLGVTGLNTFTLYCFGRTGATTNVVKTISLTVNPLPLTLTTPTSLFAAGGGNSNIGWSSPSAESCSVRITNNTSTKTIPLAVYGTLNDYITKTTTYDFTCTRSGTSVTKSATVAVS